MAQGSLSLRCEKGPCRFYVKCSAAGANRIASVAEVACAYQPLYGAQGY